MILVEEFSTAGLSQEYKLPFWNDLAANTVGPMHIEHIGQGPFEGEMCRLKIPGFEFMSPRASPVIVRSRRVDCDRTALNLTLQHVGSSMSITDREEVTLKCGDMVIYDPTRPLECRAYENMQQIVIRLPYRQVAERFPNIESLIGARLSGDSGAGRVVSSFIRNTWQELRADPASEWVEALGDVIWAMLALAYEAGGGARPTDHRFEHYRARMLACIDSHVSEPEFGTRELAEALGVSARYVQILFAKLHTTPSAFILNRRLDLAARQLKACGTRASITDVAFDAGFEHLSTFCRAFRRKFNVSPREYRAGIRAGS